MKSNIHFISEGHTIQGKFHSPINIYGTIPTILLLPGLPGNEEDVLGLGEELSQHGLNIMMFNYRGTYQSEGEYSLKNTQIDIQAAFNFLRKEETVTEYQIDTDKLVLGGYSFGGGMGLNFGSNHPEIKHIFSIGGTNHGKFADEYKKNEAYSKIIDMFFEELKYPNGPIKFSGKSAIRTELLPNSSRYDLLKKTAKLSNRDLLLISGWDDSDIVLEKHILPFYRALKREGSERVSIHAFQDDHTFELNRMELAQTILKWIETIFA